MESTTAYGYAYDVDVENVDVTNSEEVDRLLSSIDDEPDPGYEETYYDTAKYTRRIVWSIVLGCIGALVFWPLCFLGLYLVYDFKMNISSHAERRCTIVFSYWLNFCGILLGILETIVIIVLAIEGKL